MSAGLAVFIARRLHHPGRRHRRGVASAEAATVTRQPLPGYVRVPAADLGNCSAAVTGATAVAVLACAVTGYALAAAAGPEVTPWGS